MSLDFDSLLPTERPKQQTMWAKSRQEQPKYVEEEPREKENEEGRRNDSRQGLQRSLCKTRLHLKSHVKGLYVNNVSFNFMFYSNFKDI